VRALPHAADRAVRRRPGRAGIRPGFAAHRRVVNDDIISELDVFMRLRMAMLSAKLQDTEEIRRRLLPQVLRNLIDDRLKLQESKRTGVKINPADVESRIDKLAQRNNMTRAELEEFLKGNGILVDALADQLTAELSWSRLVQRTLRPRIVITDQEINEEAQRIKATKGQTEFKMYQIFLAVDAPDQESEVRDSAQRLIEQLQAGADFESLAQEFSQDEGAMKGGNWGWLRLDQMEPAVAKLIQAAAPGSLVGPVRGTGGYYIALAARDSCRRLRRHRRRRQRHGQADPVVAAVQCRGERSQPRHLSGQHRQRQDRELQPDVRGRQ
jgi:peptidyl-prolyl cis-trans isomerase SurA